MPRIRSIYPEVAELEALIAVSAYAERTLWRLITVCDDKGRCKDHALLLKAQLYPLDQQMTAERVEKDLSELAAATLLERYTVDGKRYLCVCREVWAWQKPKRPTESKLPEPPCRTPPPNGTHPQGGESSPAGSPPVPPGDGGGGGVGDGEGEPPNSRNPRGLAPARAPHPVDGPWAPTPPAAHGAGSPIDIAAHLAQRAAHAALADARTPTPADDGRSETA